MTKQAAASVLEAVKAKAKTRGALYARYVRMLLKADVAVALA